MHEVHLVSSVNPLEDLHILLPLQKAKVVTYITQEMHFIVVVVVVMYVVDVYVVWCPCVYVVCVCVWGVCMGCVYGVCHFY